MLGEGEREGEIEKEFGDIGSDVEGVMGGSMCMYVVVCIYAYFCTFALLPTFSFTFTSCMDNSRYILYISSDMHLDV